MRLQISVLSKPGGREPNEDAFGCWSAERASFCLLADGAGGHGGGDIASKIAIRVALASFQAAPDCSAPAIAAALRAAHEAIVAMQREGKHLTNMRATLVVLALDLARATARWGHLGDTRLYCFRAGRVLVRTKDHSVVQRMVDAGYLQDADVRTSPDRGRLFAALGQEENFAPAIGDELPLENGDAFLLCTDGLWEHVDEAAMLRSLAAAESTGSWLAHMEEEVLARGGKSQDNYSALAVWCGEHGSS